MTNVFIIGSKGIPAKYGGFETFVEKLTSGRISKDIKYHVSCMGLDSMEFEHNNARCFNVPSPKIGSARAILYDLKSLGKCISYIKGNKTEDNIIYLLACRIGPFLSFFKRQLRKLGIKLYINPDGHEWKRNKWNSAIRAYWKFSENMSARNADLMICDSKGIEKYIKSEYGKYNIKTIFIAYGADLESSDLNDSDDKLVEWYEKHHLKKGQYYLTVGRFVPENNYFTIISEFMKSKTNKDLVLIADVATNPFLGKLETSTGFSQCNRVKFVGTVYDENMLMKIRQNAYAYIHGHEVGGTNPSLLEALANTDMNILFDVSFNKEVASESALYFSKTDGSLTGNIERIEAMSSEGFKKFGDDAKSRIRKYYSWDKIIREYEKLFIKGL
jgi:rhamnosyltransferase